MLQVQRFPSDMAAFAVDRQEPRRCLVSGLFEEPVQVEETTRTFYTYLKPGLVYNRPCLVVAPPDDMTVLDYLEKSPWLAFAEAHALFLHVLIPGKDGWNLTGTDADYMNHVYVQINGRRSYVVMQDNIYAVGVGKGADVAQQAVMKMSSEWSGLATFGDLEEAALRNADVTAGGENTGKTELSISAAKTQVPVWMVWSENTGANASVCTYWKQMDDTEDEPYANRWADEIYLPRTVCKKSQINEEKISQVRVTNRFAGTLQEDLLEAVWAYLSKACRHRCYGTKALRNRIDPEEYGMTCRTMELDGFTRVWYEYVPERVKSLGIPVPLVVCMHGRGGTTESFISLSGMSRVAEERDFIVVFPEAGVPYLLVEAETICSSITKNTTAKITSQHGLLYHKLISRFGIERAKQYLDVNEAALQKYRELCRHMDCGFEEKAAFTYSLDDRGKIQRELNALETLGFPAEFAKDLPLPFPVAGAVCFPRQAQFHPLQFISQIARELHICEHTRVRELTGNTAVTDHGRIHAGKIIVPPTFPL